MTFSLHKPQPTSMLTSSIRMEMREWRWIHSQLTTRMSTMMSMSTPTDGRNWEKINIEITWEDASRIARSTQFPFRFNVNSAVIYRFDYGLLELLLRSMICISSIVIVNCELRISTGEKVIFIFYGFFAFHELRTKDDTLGRGANRNVNKSIYRLHQRSWQPQFHTLQFRPAKVQNDDGLSNRYKSNYIQTKMTTGNLPQHRPPSRKRETFDIVFQRRHNSRPGFCRDTWNPFEAYSVDCRLDICRRLMILHWWTKLDRLQQQKHGKRQTNKHITIDNK